jgi:hypothetical protein
MQFKPSIHHILTRKVLQTLTSEYTREIAKIGCVSISHSQVGHVANSTTRGVTLIDKPAPDEPARLLDADTIGV